MRYKREQLTMQYCFYKPIYVTRKFVKFAEYPSGRKIAIIKRNLFHLSKIFTVKTIGQYI